MRLQRIVVEVQHAWQIPKLDRHTEYVLRPLSLITALALTLIDENPQS